MTQSTTTPPDPDPMTAQIAAWIEVLRAQASKSYWTVTISSAPDGVETIEVLHSSEWVHKHSTTVIGGHRTPVIQKTRSGRLLAIGRPYSQESK